MSDQISQDDVRAYLATFDRFRQPELIAYLATAIDRFTHTLNLIPRLPNPEKVKLLEIGGTPYFMSVLVEHFFGYQVHLANEPTVFPGEEGDSIEFQNDDGKRSSFPVRRLNIEYDDWPWADETFDIVLYCEVIEHLVYDPTHTLVEAHRVLKNDAGTLIISTPNALCYTYMFDMVRGRNPYPPYDGYSHYARHHRLFSVPELMHLCSSVGYDVRACYSVYDNAYTHPAKVDRLVRWLVKRGRLRGRLDVIYVVAIPRGERRYAYPSARPFLLYQDVHGYQRVESSQLKMSDDLAQFGGGFYDVETWGGGIRWTAQQARLYLKREEQQELELAFFSSPNGRTSEVRGWVEISTPEASDKQTWAVPGASWQTLRFRLPPGRGTTSVVVGVDEPVRPSDVDPSVADTRLVGVALREASLV